MLRTKPMSHIFEICFHMHANQVANQGVIIWHVFSVKAVKQLAMSVLYVKITP